MANALRKWLIGIRKTTNEWTDGNSAERQNDEPMTMRREIPSLGFPSIAYGGPNYSHTAAAAERGKPIVPKEVTKQIVPESSLILRSMAKLAAAPFDSPELYRVVTDHSSQAIALYRVCV